MIGQTKSHKANNTETMNRATLTTAFLLALACTTLAQKQVTSDNNQQLRQLLKRFPAADTNKDGVLTFAEARAARSLMGKRNAKDRLQPTHADLKYGPHRRNKLDLFLADSDKPAPVVVCIHGGGFAGGDKSSFHANHGLIKGLNDAGISVATINYRLTEGGKHPYPAPMHDGARAVQWLRMNAEKYNLEKTLFAATGGSAGGCMSMWLGFHDDLADPDAEDPVLRESTRLIAVAPNSGQSSLHLPTLLEWFNVKSLQEHGGARPLFGVPRGGELEITEHLDALSRDASPITHLTKDDPPCYMTFGPNVKITETSTPNKWVHHPVMGFELEKAMTAIGLECEVNYRGGPDPQHSSAVQFLIAKLNAEP